jgi:hypothetical protein
MKTLNLKHIEGIIDRVSARYPYLTKHQIVVIAMTFFEVLYTALANREKVSINGFIPNISIAKFTRIVNDKFLSGYKAIVSTPQGLKQK